MTHIELQKAQEQFLELIELAARGEEVIISKGEKPFVKLVSASRLPKKRQFGSAKGLIIIADDFDDPLEDFQEYR